MCSQESGYPEVGQTSREGKRDLSPPSHPAARPASSVSTREKHIPESLQACLPGARRSTRFADASAPAGVLRPLERRGGRSSPSSLAQEGGTGHEGNYAGVWRIVADPDRCPRLVGPPPQLPHAPRVSCHHLAQLVCTFRRSVTSHSASNRSTRALYPLDRYSHHVGNQAQARHCRRRCMRQDLPLDRLLQGHFPRGESRHRFHVLRYRRSI